MPAHQIVLAVASFGHSYTVDPDEAFECDDDANVLVPFPSFIQNKQPLGDAWDDPTIGKDFCGNPTGPSGNFDFWGLIQGGFSMGRTMTDYCDVVGKLDNPSMMSQPTNAAGGPAPAILDPECHKQGGWLPQFCALDDCGTIVIGLVRLLGGF